ncbi:DUF58 domain-containing protein [Fictibacillus sp. KIGAM418]|uniref:DUF58 domain-containing protein n=1 Tax=Fictibacillus marinisediminis TaxID=2878389 RepID=A0A9X1XE16_9BACL|nr:DUF58 domain-containing protein [Fictibacillus marinisediminis]MCK6255989.1 DUF58 domain-containing protein [Fictibacillus marinisediminis]
MSVWRKELAVPKLLQASLSACVVLAAISFYKKSPAVLALACLFGAVYYLSRLYFRSAADQLVFLNPRRSIRLFPGDTERLPLTLSYEGSWPQIRGTMTFTASDAIDVDNAVLTHEKKNLKQKDYEWQFAVPKKSRLEQELMVTGKKRGAVKLNRIELSIRNVMGYGLLLLAFDPIYRTEVIVFPAPLPVIGIKPLLQFGQGFHPFSRSLFEDPASPAGARDYERSDPYNRIHWKATAASASLKTKVVEKTTEYKWAFIVNVGSSSYGTSSFQSETMENQLSYLTFMCQHASSAGIPYEIFMNIRVPGAVGFLKVEKGEDRAHLLKVLETLARISVSSVTFPLLELLAKTDREISSTIPVVILAGNLDEDGRQELYFQKWQKHGSPVYRIIEQEEGAYLSKWSARRAIS